MGKTDKALLKFREEYQIEKNNSKFAYSYFKKGEKNISKNKEMLNNLLQYENLKFSILSTNLSDNKKSLMFIGTSKGCGCSTTAENFSISLALNHKLKVLLLEMNYEDAELDYENKIKEKEDLFQKITIQRNLDSSIKKIDQNDNFSDPCVYKMLLNPIELEYYERFDEFFSFLKKHFDYIIFDAQPISLFSEYKLICKKINGIILVVEAGETKVQVALNAKNEILRAKGKILGVVLNKREYNIPKWLYKII
jgi:Mrp family chromosome partitioning ATPase